MASADWMNFVRLGAWVLEDRTVCSYASIGLICGSQFLTSHNFGVSEPVRKAPEGFPGEIG